MSLLLSTLCVLPSIAGVLSGDLQTVSITGGAAAILDPTEGSTTAGSGAVGIKSQWERAQVSLGLSVTTVGWVEGDTSSPFGAALLKVSPESSNFYFDSSLYPIRFGEGVRSGIGLHPDFVGVLSTWAFSTYVVDPNQNPMLTTRNEDITMVGGTLPLSYQAVFLDDVDQRVAFSLDAGFALRAALGEEDFVKQTLGTLDPLGANIPADTTWVWGPAGRLALQLNSVTVFAKVLMLRPGEVELPELTGFRVILGTHVEGNMLKILDRRGS